MKIETCPDLANRLSQLLQTPSCRPARWARERFAPEMCYGRHFGPCRASTRPAAVLVGLYQAEGEWRLPLTLRPSHLAAHGGQISLPGGASEPGETSVDTALREAQEEIGIDPQQARTLGELSESFVFVSDFRVTPVVASFAESPQWKIDDREVSQLIEVPLSELLDEGHRGTQLMQRPLLATPSSGAVAANPDPPMNQGLSSVDYLAPTLLCGRHPVWGATAIMLGELIALLEFILSVDGFAQDRGPKQNLQQAGRS